MSNATSIMTVAALMAYRDTFKISAAAKRDKLKELEDNYKAASKQLKLDIKADDRRAQEIQDCISLERQLEHDMEKKLDRELEDGFKPYKPSMCDCGCHKLLSAWDENLKCSCDCSKRMAG